MLGTYEADFNSTLTSTLYLGRYRGSEYDACVAVKIFRGALYGYVRFAQLMAEDLQALSQQEFGGEFIASDELFGLSEYFDAQISKLSEPVERIQDALEALRKEVSVQLERRTRGDEVWDIRLLDYMIGFFEISGDVPDRTEGGKVTASRTSCVRKRTSRRLVRSFEARRTSAKAQHGFLK